MKCSISTFGKALIGERCSVITEHIIRRPSRLFDFNPRHLVLFRKLFALFEGM